MKNNVTTIKLVTLGHIPFSLNKKDIKRFKSQFFQVSSDIEHFDTVEKISNGKDWDFTDEQLAKVVPQEFSEDVLIALVSVPLEANYYVRTLSKNTFVLSFHETAYLLDQANIPLKNLVYRVLYSAALCHQASKQTKKSMHDIKYGLVHHETKGCLFDMTGLKHDIIYSTVNPILCAKCRSHLEQFKISTNMLENLSKELPRIKKDVFHQLNDFIKRKPICSLLITSASVIILGIISSVVAAYISHQILR